MEVDNEEDGGERRGRRTRLERRRRPEQTTASWRLHHPWELPEDPGGILQVDW